MTSRAFDRAAYDRVLDSFPHDDPSYKSYIDHARERMWKTLAVLPPGKPGARLLDIGSFQGLFAPLYLDLWSYGEVELLGYDVAAGGELERRNAAGKTYRFRTSHANIELDRFPYPDGSFDAVVCTDVFEHLIFDPLFAMNEISRVLKPGGHALIAVPNAVSDEILTFLVNNRQPGFLRYYIRDALAGGRRDIGTIYNLGHFHEYTAPELAGLAAAAGFRTETLTSFNYRRPQYGTWRYRLTLGLVRALFPRSLRLRGEELAGLFVKERHTPTEMLQDRYPAPLYGALVPD